MKHSAFKQMFTLMVGVTVMLLCSASAEPHHNWGAASNGICIGLGVTTNSIKENDVYCAIDVRNMSTNRLYLWYPPNEKRFELELRGPDGQRIRQLKPILFRKAHPWRGLEPVAKDGYWGSLDWFFLAETFDVRTNGLHTLIVSARVNAFTNFAVGRSQMQEKPVYYLLPTVTNTFDVLPGIDCRQSK